MNEVKTIFASPGALRAKCRRLYGCRGGRMPNIDAIRGLKDLFVSAINSGTTTVEEFHAAIARRPFEALELDPATRVPATAVRMLHDIISGCVYWGLRSLMELAGDAADWALTPS